MEIIDSPSSVKEILPHLASLILKYAWLIVFLFSILVNLTLFQNIRPIQSDEVNHVDSSYSIYLGSPIPTFNTWSHIFPDAAVINFNYPPIYFYVTGFFMKVVSFNPLAMGMFHLLCRLLTGLFLFFTMKRLNLNHWLSMILTLWWISYSRSGFYVGRPDDFAVLFTVLAFYLLIVKNSNQMNFVAVGILLGISFLIYPVALIIGGILCLAYLLWRKLINPKIMLILTSSTAFICLLWLIWIIPYYGEFKRYFLDFVIPEARAVDYLLSIRDHLLHIIQGGGSSWSINFSALPLLFLFGFSVMILIFNNPKGKKDLILIPILIGLFIGALLLISSNRYHAYAVTWLTFLLICLLSILLIDSPFFNKSGKLYIRIPIFILMGALVFQEGVSVLYQGLNFYGNILFTINCEEDIYSRIRKIIDKGDKVLTSNGVVYYAVRSENPVYWPAGISGITVGGLPYATDYDQTYKWLVTSEPISDNIKIGEKFYWDDASRRYFLNSYTLVDQLTSEVCLENDHMIRFSTVPKSLYFYTRVRNNIVTEE